MGYRTLTVAATMTVITSLALSAAPPKPTGVNPWLYDPGKTGLVASSWEPGLGCTTNGAVFDGTASHPFTDAACSSGDAKDNKNAGLLLVKTGPTNNYAAAGADIKDVKGLTLTELGYDIRKIGDVTDGRGSQCDAGTPRFNIELQDGRVYFLGCNSPSASSQVASGYGWIRLRWTGPVMAYNSQTLTLDDLTGLPLKSLSIILDEGQDSLPSFFGLAVLDNIDVNGVLIGKGPEKP